MKKLPYILLFLLLYALSFWAGFQVGHRSVRQQPADTVRLTDTFRLPAPVVRHEVKVPVPAEVDTAAILAAYYTQRIYVDTVVCTKYVQVSLRDTVYQNRLLGRTAVAQLRIPEQRHSFSAGIMAGHQSLRLMAGYRYRQTEFLAGYDLSDKCPFVGLKHDLWRW